MTPALSAGTRRVVSTCLATAYGRFRMLGFEGVDGAEHVALVLGDVTGPPPLVRVHSECLTGDALGSRRCDCGEQLQAAMRTIGYEGRGVVVYLRGHEGRGIGLLAKLRAYALQDDGLDTVDANLRLGFPADARSYEAAADILHELGVARIRLLSSNPDKAAKLGRLGIDVVERQALEVADRPENAFYLTTKRQRMGHDSLSYLGRNIWDELRAGRVPAGATNGLDWDLLDRYGPLVAAGPQTTIAQLAQSADGFIASRTGEADYLSGPSDHEHLHRLRALVDAVVVGASTVLADDPRLTVRAVPGASPVRVVLDPHGRLDLGCGLLSDGAARTLWVVGDGVSQPAGLAPHVEVHRLQVSEGVFAPGEVLPLLHGLGLGRVLIEGGGRLVSAFLADGRLDRLFLTTVPILIGDGVPGIRFPGADRLIDARRVPTRRHLLGEDVCLEFDLAKSRRKPR